MAESDVSHDRPDIPVDDARAVEGSDAGGGRRNSRTWIVVVLVIVALVIGALTVVLLVEDGAGIHDGPGTATFTWTPVVQDYSAATSRTEPQPFSADIEGHPVTGTATVVVPSGVYGTNGSVGGRLPTGTIPAFHYRGTFAGTRFDLTVYVRIPTTADQADPAASAAAASGIRLTVAGTYGGSPVRATVTPPSSGGPAPTDPARFVGTVGHRKVTGTISQTMGTSVRRTVSAHFVVSG
ncbi:MAG TPA: hypothetical protein VND44_02575 [Acidimicrobiales bacterium]|nr:hypothetical protein [Acidimicrobiales bacterium]